MFDFATWFLVGMAVAAALATIAFLFLSGDPRFCAACGHEFSDRDTVHIGTWFRRYCYRCWRKHELGRS